jgi:hypothetical protein
MLHCNHAYWKSLFFCCNCSPRMIALLCFCRLLSSTRVSSHQWRQFSKRRWTQYRVGAPSLCNYVVQCTAAAATVVKLAADCCTTALTSTVVCSRGRIPAGHGCLCTCTLPCRDERRLFLKALMLYSVLRPSSHASKCCWAVLPTSAYPLCCVRSCAHSLRLDSVESEHRCLLIRRTTRIGVPLEGRQAASPCLCSASAGPCSDLEAASTRRDSSTRLALADQTSY